MPYPEQSDLSRQRVLDQAKQNHRNPNEDPRARQLGYADQGAADQRRTTGASDPQPRGRLNPSERDGGERDRTLNQDKATDQYKHPGWN